MTGFARSEGSLGDKGWFWEVRSVNGRGLDFRLRLPPGFEGLEQKAREAAQKAMKRGNVSATLTLQKRSGAAEIRLNEAALEQVLEAAERVRQRIGGDAPKVEALLGLKGVLEVVDGADDSEDTKSRDSAVLASLHEAIGDLVSAREGEGRRMAEVIGDQVSEIERLVGVIEAAPARSIEAVRMRLADQVARLREADGGLDENRLHQEAVLIATRLDVEEELKRLRSHIASARELLGESGAVGRRFDFLAQEFNREANTICSKSGDEATTQAGMALKVVIDQMREQVQNIE